MSVECCEKQGSVELGGREPNAARSSGGHAFSVDRCSLGKDARPECERSTRSFPSKSRPWQALAIPPPLRKRLDCRLV